jgi:hypothetical protein
MMIKIIQNVSDARHQMMIGRKFYKLLNFHNSWSFNIEAMGEERNVVCLDARIAMDFL